MSPADIVRYSGLKMSEFAARYVIPYRTLQACCNGTNPCPIYTRIMLCELLGILSMTEKNKVLDSPCFFKNVSALVLNYDSIRQLIQTALLFLFFNYKQQAQGQKYRNNHHLIHSAKGKAICKYPCNQLS